MIKAHAKRFVGSLTTGRLLFLLFLAMVVIAIVAARAHPVTKSLANATDKAESEFKQACSIGRFPCDGFDGPRLQQEAANSYQFRWDNEETNDRVLVSVFYEPHYAELYFLLGNLADLMKQNSSK